MSQMTWTTAQQAAIDARGQNLLLSAAAGSGKTAVLTERIKKLITDMDDLPTLRNFWFLHSPARRQGK